MDSVIVRHVSVLNVENIWTQTGSEAVSVHLQRVQHPLLLLQLVLQGLDLWTRSLVLFGVQGANHLERTHLLMMV